jgi:hypothetical protein
MKRRKFQEQMGLDGDDAIEFKMSEAEVQQEF